MTESEAKLIESMAYDYSNVLKEAKSMGCNDIRALYNIPLKNMELIINALEKQIAKKPYHISQVDDNYNANVECQVCHAITDYAVNIIKRGYCWKCGQLLDWSDEE